MSEDRLDVTISEATRRDIIDSILLEGVSWSGRLEEPDFLLRIFDLKKMPSTDSRFTDAYRDVWQHRVNNPFDWEDDWVFHDGRLNLLHGSDDNFLRFLCETIHPVVRPDPAEVERLRDSYNGHLRNDGYEIVERTRVADRPIFIARQSQLGAAAHVSALKERFSEDAAAYTARQITRMESSIYDDPGLAIGTAKELVETICRTILAERAVHLEGSPEIPQLVKATFKELDLVPEDVPDRAKANDVIKKLLSNLATVAGGLAELRNKYGTGHGKEARAKGLGPRHAKLAAGAASALAVFLLETHEEKPKDRG